MKSLVDKVKDGAVSVVNGVADGARYFANSSKKLVVYAAVGAVALTAESRRMITGMTETASRPNNLAKINTPFLMKAASQAQKAALYRADMLSSVQSRGLAA